jgi:aryl-alcohol dehydrogenase-like predicted oxidoreductase
VRYRWLADTGLRVSEIALGSSPFGGQMGSTSGVDQDGANRIVGRALEAGVNLFDTADVYSYGEAEERLGRALASHRDEVLLTTKIGFRVAPAANHAGASRVHLVRQVESSLRRLGVEHLDVLYLHIWDEHAALEDVMLTLDFLIASGKVRYAGVSNFPAWWVASANSRARALARPGFVLYQGLWNVLCRDCEDQVVPMCRELGLGFVAWGSLAYGMLTGKYRRGEERPADSRLRDPGSHESRYLKLDDEQVFDVVEGLGAIAAARGVTPGQVALAWLRAQPGLTSMLIGARTVEQLEENLAAVELDLSQDELDRVDELSPAPQYWPSWQVESNRASRIAEMPH